MGQQLGNNWLQWGNNGATMGINGQQWATIGQQWGDNGATMGKNGQQWETMIPYNVYPQLKFNNYGHSDSRK